MKTRLAYLLLLILNFSCVSTNRPATEAEKEKIKTEVKEIVDAVFKASEEANFELITKPWLDSPDFVILINGRTFSYQEAMAMKPAYSKILNQKGTILNEKYTVLDRSTVVYTANATWKVNYRAGHSILEDPEAFMFLFKKIDKQWRIVYYADSYVEQYVKDKENL